MMFIFGISRIISRENIPVDRSGQTFIETSGIKAGQDHSSAAEYGAWTRKNLSRCSKFVVDFEKMIVVVCTKSMHTFGVFDTNLRRFCPIKKIVYDCR